MDPTKIVTTIPEPGEDISSFGSLTSSEDGTLPTPYTQRHDEVDPQPSLEWVDVKVKPKFNPQPIYVDLDKYTFLNSTIKESYSNIPEMDFFKYRSLTNPYESLGKGPFQNRAALKLANIDAIWHLTGHQTGIFKKRIGSDFNFVDLAGGPGGFSEYLQYRRYSSRGMGVTLRGPLDFNMKRLDSRRFEPYYGDDSSGNLYNIWDSIVDKAKSMGFIHIDLVVADGGFDVTGDDFYRQEFLSSRLILTETYLGISLTRKYVPEEGQKPDLLPIQPLTSPPSAASSSESSSPMVVMTRPSSFVLKVFDTMTKISADTIFVLTQCFEKVFIFKPITSRPANSERYVICQGRREHEYTAPWKRLLSNILKAYDVNGEDQMLTKMLPELPKSFTDWLTSQNNLSVQLQIDTGAQILTLAGLTDQDPKSVILPKVDVEKCLLVWNLPDSPDITDFNLRRTLVRVRR